VLYGTTTNENHKNQIVIFQAKSQDQQKFNIREAIWPFLAS
jgi:hypothetical protein